MTPSPPSWRSVSSRRSYRQHQRPTPLPPACLCPARNSLACPCGVLSGGIVAARAGLAALDPLAGILVTAMIGLTGMQIFVDSMSQLTDTVDSTYIPRIKVQPAVVLPAAPWAPQRDGRGRHYEGGRLTSCCLGGRGAEGGDGRGGRNRGQQHPRPPHGPADAGGPAHPHRLPAQRIGGAAGGRAGEAETDRRALLHAATMGTRSCCDPGASLRCRCGGASCVRSQR